MTINGSNGGDHRSVIDAAKAEIQRTARLRAELVAKGILGVDKTSKEPPPKTANTQTGNGPDGDDTKSDASDNGDTQSGNRQSGNGHADDPLSDIVERTKQDPTPSSPTSWPLPLPGGCVSRTRLRGSPCAPSSSPPARCSR
jgi:hypothetical protein